MLGSSFVFVLKNKDKQLIGMYFAKHADGSVEARTSFGQLVPCTLGDERRVHGRRLAAAAALPKENGKREGVVNIGPLRVLEDELVGGGEGVDTPVWQTLTAVLEHLGLKRTLIKTTDKKFTAELQKLNKPVTDLSLAHLYLRGQ